MTCLNNIILRCCFNAARLVGEDDAEDIVQDVFVELWNNKSKIDF